MKITPLPDAAYLHECFLLDHDALIWRERPPCHFPAKGVRSSALIAKMWNSKMVGTRAGRIMQAIPYRQIGISGTRYLEHRIIAAMVGMPVDQLIDHIDGNSLNNHPSNLRAATPQQNSFNNEGWKRRREYPGVYLRKGRWIALIRIGDSNKSMGTYASHDEAVQARIRGEVENRGDFGFNASRHKEAQQ